MTKATIAQLNPSQRRRLSILTKRIQANLAALLDLSRPTLAIAADLRAIHAEKLYVEHGTFHQFCKEVFGFDRNRGYQLLEAACVVEDLQGMAAPKGEWQTRPLSGLSAKDRRAVWSKAIEDHGLEPTANEVRATLDRLAAQDRLQSVREQEQAARQRSAAAPYDPRKALAGACAIALAAASKARHAADMARRAGADDHAEQFERAADLLVKAAS